MRSTPSIRNTRRSSASISMHFSCRSPTPASRLSKLPTCSCARARSTFSSSTPSQHLRQRPKSKARWATLTWASRRASCRRRFASLPVRSIRAAPPLFSLTSCARRSACSSAAPKPPRVAKHSSSMLRCAWTFAASRPSNRAPMRLATALASRS